MSPMLVFAHATHWLASLLYVVPVLVVLGALGLQVAREKRDDGGEHNEPPPVGD